jgi:hypothetical protein
MKRRSVWRWALLAAVLATAGFFLTRGHHGLDETPLPAAPGAALRADVVLAPHAVAPIARATPPATAEVQTSLHGALISARNRDAVTPGIVAVTPLGAGQMFVEHSPASATISVAVDSLGLFSFSKLSPGRYWLDASAPGYARETRVVHVPLATAVIIPLRDAAFLSGFVTGEDGAPVAQAEVLAISAANEVRGESDSSGAFSLEVAPGMAGVFAHKNSLSGRLEFPVEAKAGESVKGLHLVLRNGTTLSGRVHGDDGKAIAGAQLALSLESERRAVSLREGISDREGNFVFDGLAPGKYELDALANGYARGNAVHVIVTSATSRVDVVLHRAAALEGNVTDPSGAPIAGAVVQFFGSRDDETATDRDGHYAFADLEAGQAIVAAHRREETVGASQKIALMGGETTHQDLRLGAARRSLGTGQRDAFIGRRKRWRHGVRRDRHRGQLRNPLAARRLPVERPPDRLGDGLQHFARRPNFIGAGDDVTLDLYLSQAGPDDGIHGLVIEPGGAPCSRPLISAVIEGVGQRNFRGREDGTFDMPAPQLPEGQTQIQFFAKNGGRAGSVKVSVQAAVNLVIQLSPAAALEGEVRRADQQSIDSFSVELQHPDSVWAYLDELTGPVQVQGATFLFDDLVPGTTGVVATAADGSSDRKRLELTAASLQRVSLRLTR